ncbi:unnamed protein product [Caenorhabditis sp. 36 PRJEB53466]|nr:unnamed protein product [Caenorhabditis sp. 36 PRJEB53466]
MDHSMRTIGKGEALRIDSSLRGETLFSAYRSHSKKMFFDSSIGARVSIFSSRNSETSPQCECLTGP